MLANLTLFGVFIVTLGLTIDESTAFAINDIITFIPMGIGAFTQLRECFGQVPDHKMHILPQWLQKHNV